MATAPSEGTTSKITKYQEQRVVSRTLGKATTQVFHPETSDDIVKIQNPEVIGLDKASTDVRKALKEITDVTKSGVVASIRGEAEPATIKDEYDIPHPNRHQGHVVFKKEWLGLEKVDNVKQIPYDYLPYLPDSTEDRYAKVAPLDPEGKVPATFLPSYVDDVIECYAKHVTTTVDGKEVTTLEGLYQSYDTSTKAYSNKITTTSTPIKAEAGKIYTDLIENKTYRWGGSQFTVISETLSLGETSTTAYPGNQGKNLKDTIDKIIAGERARTINGVPIQPVSVAARAATMLNEVVIEDGITEDASTSTDPDIAFDRIRTHFGYDENPIVLEMRIRDAKVSTRQLAKNAVSTEKIGSGQVTTEKLAVPDNSTLTPSTGQICTAFIHNDKGQIIDAGRSMCFGTSSNDTVPSDLIVGGIFFKYLGEIEVQA